MLKKTSLYIKYILFGLLLATIASVSVLMFRYFYKAKLVYVNSKMVFDEFEMTKEYKVSLEKVTNARKYILDSTELAIKRMRIEIESSSNPKAEAIKYFEYHRNQFLEKQKEFEKDNEILINRYDTEIFNRINQYAKDYGAEKGLDFLIGADGQGVLLYANEDLDVSKDFIQYCNLKYIGNR